MKRPDTSPLIAAIEAFLDDPTLAGIRAQAMPVTHTEAIHRIGVSLGSSGVEVRYHPKTFLRPEGWVVINDKTGKKSDIFPPDAVHDVALDAVATALAGR